MVYNGIDDDCDPAALDDDFGRSRKIRFATYLDSQK